jgi:hypothetical protein
MKSLLALTVLLLGAASLVVAQAPGNPPPQRSQPGLPAANLSAILAQIQQAVQSANTDIGRLRIEKWKTDADQKEQLRQMADSLQRNITTAMPALISDVQASSGNVSTTFKLYHNLNVLYEFLIYLADAAGSMTRKDEYEPLANDASALDSARQGLSIYIEQTALKLETPRSPTATPASTQTAAPPPPKKIVIDDSDPPKQPVKPSKKKTSAASPQPPPAPR